MSPVDPQANRRAIAILTDFGVDSFYVGAIKGAILGVDPNAVMVDVSHSVAPRSIDEGSFLLARALEVFHEGTVFLAVVDPGVGGRRRNLIAKIKDRYFVGPDNGLISDVVDEWGAGTCYSIRSTAVNGIRTHQGFGKTFLGRDVFAPVAAAIAAGESVRALGRRVKGAARINLPEVELSEGQVAGSNRYVDSFGNIFTNISGHHLRKAFADHPLERIRVTVDNRVEVEGIHHYFAQGREGNLMALLNSWNLIELSVNGGRAIDRFADLATIHVRLEAF
ncbi:MAG: SAM-dependent chlorinase/fluorinase [Candidatus Krumholzibacteria bacterium]|nr:SAM-dependent chlorinase/fluorinase [Candidatus Krumholzibacteria bacterium]